jgi:uncharacterized protein DUF5329
MARWAILFLLATGFNPVVASAMSPLTEQEKIERLLELVGTSDAVFVRNGTDHTPAEAEKHLRSKWKFAGNKIKTARDFVEKVASTSSMTGRPYLIRRKDGTETPARDWFLAALDVLERSEPTPGAAAVEGGPEGVLALLRDSKLVFLRDEVDSVETRDGAEMAGHIRLKYVVDGSPRLETEAFIDRYCTRSVVHGTLYRVQFPDGTTKPLGQWLREQVAAGPAGPSSHKEQMR